MFNYLNMKRITVFVITYNQEKIVRRALDSILCQKEYGLHQIIVGDDCSKDGTYDTLLEYQNKYPSLVKPIRNERNLGIYGNLQNLIQYRDKSDLYLLCSGDDAFCDGYFQSIQEFIEKNDIQLNEDVGIYSDWKGIDPVGHEIIWRQDIVSKNYRLWGLQMRGLISTRSLAFSQSVIDKFQPVPLDKGLRVAESLFDSQPARIINKAYYLPYVASVYYTGIGVSTELSKTGYATTENIEKWDYYLNNLINEPKDVYFAQFQIYRSKFLMTPNTGGIIKSMWFYLRGLYPINAKNLKSMIIIARKMIRYYRIHINEK